MEKNTKEEPQKEENNASTPFMKATRDVLSLEIRKPVLTRMRNRLRELKEMGEAKHVKIMRGNVAEWHTEPPKVHMTFPNASLQNGVATITYTKFKMNKEGDKEIRVTKGRSPVSDREIEVAAEYVQDCMVIETIEPNKPMKSEEVR